MFEQPAPAAVGGSDEASRQVDETRGGDNGRCRTWGPPRDGELRDRRRGVRGEHGLGGLEKRTGAVATDLGFIGVEEESAQETSRAEPAGPCADVPSHDAEGVGILAKVDAQPQVRSVVVVAKKPDRRLLAVRGAG